MNLWPYVSTTTGLPSWVRADLRAMPTEWAGKTDLRTRRPMVNKVPVRPAGRTGAGHGCPPPVTGRTAAAVVLAVAVVVVWRRL